MKKQLLIHTFIFFVIVANAQDAIADKMLLFQRTNGGWPKQLDKVAIDYNQNFDASTLKSITAIPETDATIDNKATTKEIRYLLKAYQQYKNQAYLKSAEKGLAYLIEMQYGNGGFPQFYPDMSSYKPRITYNDNAMINVLQLFQDVVNKKAEFASINNKFIPYCEDGIKRGIDCILKTQIKQGNILTAWCAQHSEINYKPAPARAFELESISGSESVGIVEFLMQQPNPSTAIITAIKSAMAWFETVKIKGYNFIEIANDKLPKGIDKVLVEDANSTIWARFYDLNSNKPFFCGRDGKKKFNVADIEHERRIGYGWYGTWPQKLIEKKYPEWLAKNNIQP